MITWARTDHPGDCDCERCLLWDARQDMDPSHILGIRDSWIVCLSHGFTLLALSSGIDHDDTLEANGIAPLDHHLGTCSPRCDTCESVLGWTVVR